MYEWVSGKLCTHVLVALFLRFTSSFDDDNHRTVNNFFYCNNYDNHVDISLYAARDFLSTFFLFSSFRRHHFLFVQTEMQWVMLMSSAQWNSTKCFFAESPGDGREFVALTFIRVKKTQWICERGCETSYIHAHAFTYFRNSFPEQEMYVYLPSTLKKWTQKKLSFCFLISPAPQIILFVQQIKMRYKREK